VSAYSAIRIAGLKALLASAGEVLQVGDQTPTALVNRRPVKLKDGISIKEGKFSFNVAGLTEIEILRADLAEPSSGQSFVDTLGWRHRVQLVTQTDITWVLYCNTSKVIVS